MNTIEVISYSLEGNSCPIVVKKDGEKFFVKLRAGLSGEYSLASEWFGNSVGTLMGLNTRPPEWIELNGEIVFNDIYIEVRDLIEKSRGVNIGFRYIENVESVDSIDLEGMAKGRFTDAFLFDILMLNIDRTRANPNVLKENGALLLSDYESSLLLSQLIDGRDYLSNARILECLRNNLFYQKVERSEVESFLSRVDAISFDKLLADLPKEVLNEAKREKLLIGLAKGKSERWHLEETLQKLEKVVVETDGESAARTRRNRERLKGSKLRP